MKNLKLIFLVTVLILVNACTNSNTKESARGLASGEREIFLADKFESPVEILLNTEYRGTFVADIGAVTRWVGIPGVLERDCTGSISLWFYKDSKGKLRYYSVGNNADGANCNIPKIGDLSQKSQGGMDKCAGYDFNYKVVDLENIDYLRELDFESMRINAPVCSKTKIVDEYKDTLELKILKRNGGNGNLHLQITMFKN